jgi:hypothetical protein
MADQDDPFVDRTLEAAGARWRASLAEPPPVDASLFSEAVRADRARWRWSPAAGLVGLAAVVLIAVVAIGTATGGSPGGGPGAGTVATPSRTATSTPTAASATAGESAASVCHPTLPIPVFVAPPPFPAKPPAYYGAAWYGSEHLWTMLDTSGETWEGLPSTAAGYGQKTWWWSVDWSMRTELEPAISVTGRRLDGPGTFEAGPGTNGTADFGTAMLVGVDVPTTGCWELTGRYRSASLSYVVLVRD